MCVRRTRSAIGCDDESVAPHVPDELERRTLKRLDDIRSLASTALITDPARWTAETLSERITQVTRLHHGTIHTIVSAVFAEAGPREDLRRQRGFAQWLRMGIRDRAELVRRATVEWQLDELSAATVVDRLITSARRNGVAFGELAKLPAPPPPDGQADWDLLERRISRLLTRRDVGMIRVSPWEGVREAGWTLRLDWVATQNGNTVHIVCRATQPEPYAALRSALTLRLSDVPSRPLVHVPRAVETLPVLMIRREPTSAEAASLTVELLRDSLNLRPSSVNDRHQTLNTVAHSETQRVRRLARAYRSAPSGYCVECHRPLSDPESLRRGWGPVCYERLHPDLKVVVSSGWALPRAREESTTPEGLPPADWRQQVATAWWERDIPIEGATRG